MVADAQLNNAPSECKVRVDNLPYEAVVGDLANHFCQMGEPVDCQIIRLGEAVILYESAEEALEAAELYNGSQIGDSEIQTSVWKSATDGSHKRGGKANNEHYAQHASASSVYPKSATNGSHKRGGKANNNNEHYAQHASASSAYPIAGNSNVPVYWLQVPQCSTVGDDLNVPALVWEKGSSLFNSARLLVSEMLKDDNVEITHDADWEQFPELGEALKEATNEEHCVAIAISKSTGVCGVGASYGWKGREASAKLALAYNIAYQDPSLLTNLGHYPEFVALCQSQGVNVPSISRKANGKGGMASTAENSGPVHWVQVPECSQIVDQGFRDIAPALVWEKGSSLFSSSNFLISEIFGADDVEITHDADWKHFPELGAALKQATGVEHCVAIAVSKSTGMWAIGAAYSWKGREASAKIALAFEFACQEPLVVADLGQYPEFVALCQGQRIGTTNRSIGTTNRSKKAWGKGHSGNGTISKANNATTKCTKVSPNGAPPAIHTVVIPEDSDLSLKGFQTEAPVMLLDKSVRSYFCNAGEILAELVSDESEVAYIDDPEWTEIPEVGAAFASCGIAENYYMVGCHEETGLWAVGLAGGRTNREIACKLALSVAISASCGRLNEMSQKYPEFAEVLRSAGYIDEIDAHPQKKRRKGVW